jgi:bacillithiol biosynthesis cysteine-adding enzyme BshC
MPTSCYLPYAATRRFSPLVLDYLDNNKALAPFYEFRPDASGLDKAIEARRNFKVDRRVLVEVLKEQYQHLPEEEKVERAIQLLLDEGTFTICTAHQPNLATGYLYFVYKILHVVKLAEELKGKYPQHQFVPVYYMGSEDADLDELGTFRFRDRKFVWDADGQTGAVGRMSTASLEPLLKELFALIGPPGKHAESLEHLLREAYQNHDTVAKATQYLVHQLFGKYGLLVLDPDDARLKRSFIPVMQEDLLLHAAEALVGTSIEQLTSAGYKAQAQPRSINLFYLKDDIRERIELQDDKWVVLNTDIIWAKEELLAELNEHPERFSPNVMLRPLYQETILPDIAFIGGGAEVAYWLQLSSLFEHHKVFYPTVMLRQSIMWVANKDVELKDKLGLDYGELCSPAEVAARVYIGKMNGEIWTTAKEHDQMEVLLSGIREKAAGIDPSLRASADAVLARMKKQLTVLEGKMLRAMKRKEQTSIERIQRLQGSLFPGGGLAERVKNYMPYYLQYGDEFFDYLLSAIEPLRSEFLIIEEEKG